MLGRRTIAITVEPAADGMAMPPAGSLSRGLRRTHQRMEDDTMAFSLMVLAPLPHPSVATEQPIAAPAAPGTEPARTVAASISREPVATAPEPRSSPESPRPS